MDACLAFMGRQFLLFCNTGASNSAWIPLYQRPYCQGIGQLPLQQTVLDVGDEVGIREETPTGSERGKALV